MYVRLPPPQIKHVCVGLWIFGPTVECLPAPGKTGGAWHSRGPCVMCMRKGHVANGESRIWWLRATETSGYWHDSRRT